jgi:hypothetical protein
MKQQTTPTTFKIGLSLNTNIVKAAIITAASNTRKPREAIARVAINVSGHTITSAETKI